MHSKLILPIGLSCLSLAAAAPVVFPPVQTIEETAHGSLPNGPPPPTLSDDSLTSLKLIAFNELTEVAFFSKLLYNITNQVEGYHHHDIGDDETVEFVTQAITTILAQEELHALNANNALTHFKQAAIEACTYSFPVAKFKDAVALAAEFTDVVLGTLQQVQTLATTDDPGLIQGVGSVIGQEGEQNGFYRTILGKVPSVLPFLTTSTREFAFSTLNQNFVVAGSCPNSNTIDLPVFKPLTITGRYVDPKLQLIDFSIAPISGANYSSLSITYINQQNIPVVEPLQSVHVGADAVTFKATFPFNGTTFGNGLTIAALTQGATSFASAKDVAAKTIAGPGLIEVN
jgi:hypothetical protein